MLINSVAGGGGESPAAKYADNYVVFKNTNFPIADKTEAQRVVALSGDVKTPNLWSNLFCSGWIQQANGGGYIRLDGVDLLNTHIVGQFKTPSWGPVKLEFWVEQYSYSFAGETFYNYGLCCKRYPSSEVTGVISMAIEIICFDSDAPYE